MKSIFAVRVAGVTAAGFFAFAAVAQDRPSAPPQQALLEEPEPSACFKRLDAGLAEIRPMPPIGEPSGCIVEAVVTLAAIMLHNGHRVSLAPSAILRCEFAEALVHWIREDVAGALADATADGVDSPMAVLREVSAFECRLRNRQTNGRISEHGLANAIDIRGIGLADGRRIDFTDMSVSADLRKRLRESACARFTTVLGPGSDVFHESHIHFDLAQRRGNYRLCQWDVRTPADLPVAAASPPLLADPPLPKPRPTRSPRTGALTQAPCCVHNGARIRNTHAQQSRRPRHRNPGPSQY